MGVGEIRIGKTGLGKMGIGKMGVGETGTTRKIMNLDHFMFLFPVRIKCRDLVKKIAIYRHRLAVSSFDSMKIKMRLK